MTSPDEKRPFKSPARPKPAASPMTQKSLFSFFKPVNTTPQPPASKPESTSSSSSRPSTISPTTPQKQSSAYEPLFSTDEAVQPRTPPSKLAKRKTMTFDDDDSLLPQELDDYESRSVKKFAAAVGNLSLSTPVKKPQFDAIDMEDEDDESPLGGRRPRRGARRVKYQFSDDDDDDDDDAGKSPIKKSTKSSHARRAKADSDDDGSEYEAPAAEEDDDFNMEIDPDELDEKSLMEDDDDAELDALSTAPTKTKTTSKPTPSVVAKPGPSKTTASLFQNRSPATPQPTAPSRPALGLKDDKKRERAAKFEEKNNDRYAWLLNICDDQRNPIGSPDYDPRTLYIPKAAWAKFTEFERQFWEIKSQHFDTVVFFKKGKFYELYENDADIGHQQFDLKLTDRTNMRMVGVPESSFDYWSAQFIAKGYKVARVDQMETALGKAMRERGGGKPAQKVIRRELHSILTAGTLTDSGLLTSDMATYCMAIKESFQQGAEHLPARFGIAFVDTSTAEFSLATFKDDMDRTKFETLVTQIKPRELVVEKGGLSQRSIRILKNSLGPNTIWNHLHHGSEFWDEVQTKDELRVRGYFNRQDSKDENKDSKGDASASISSDSWPDALRQMESNDLVMCAVGGLVWYLRSLKLDDELLSFQNFSIYDPIRQASTLILDGQTLSNLEVFQNSVDGGEQGTLFHLLNRCVTPFGKRLFRRWLCHPLRSRQAINARLDAVEDLMRVPGFLELFEERCTRLPDLERIISRIHAGSCKISEFLTILSTFHRLVKTMDKLASYKDQFQSGKIPSIIAEFPDLTGYLEYFDAAFDHAAAAAEGEVTPHPGFAADYDANNAELQEIEAEFAAHLAEAKIKLKTTKLAYKDIGKEVYQLEVPNKVAVPRDWKKMSGTNALNRYYNPTLTRLVTRLMEARETKSMIVKQLQGRLYAQFDAHYKEWLQAAKIVAELDCLGSLCKSSLALGSPACKPEFVESDKAVVELRGLRHPCVVPGIAADFIPNDTVLGGQEPNLILLTGPNMGGKSTLLRQTCVAIIMAQLGCYVPAEKCRLTPMDRIFTRIGANDNILAGQSTFMVELSETSKILAEATEHSMVILDELGRGTSTFDGYAIAYSVLHELSTRTGCLGLFSTHYGLLTDEFRRDPNVALKHMACQVDQEHREVTFLYKLVEGVSEKSYGMNVAHMAGVPKSIVERAEAKAHAFEVKQEKKRASELAYRRGAKDVGLGTIMDLAYLLQLAAKAGGRMLGVSSSSDAALAMAMDGVEEDSHADGQPSALATRKHRPLTREQQTRIVQRIMASMASI
ncbi:DNA mismatch repair protein msh6 [Actinomortierella ambigua]|nr:DNA mismatch repair protein msh6 [Actinomortierella ambigua]